MTTEHKHGKKSRSKRAVGSLGDEQQQFQGLNGDFMILVKGHGDDPILEHKQEVTHEHMNGPKNLSH